LADERLFDAQRPARDEIGLTDVSEGVAVGSRECAVADAKRENDEGGAEDD
jgi:hypothetical protein